MNMVFIIWYLIFAAIISLIAMRRDKEVYVNDPNGAVIFFGLGILFAPILLLYLVWCWIGSVIVYLMRI